MVIIQGKKLNFSKIFVEVIWLYIIIESIKGPFFSAVIHIIFPKSFCIYSDVGILIKDYYLLTIATPNLCILILSINILQGIEEESRLRVNPLSPKGSHFYE